MVQMNFATHDVGFKLILILVVGCGIFTTAYGDNTAKFGHRLLPEKMLENTEGLLEVYAVQDNSGIIPQPINGLIVRSSDPSVVSIIGVEENENGFITNVKIKATSAGTANIALIAPGFSSEEFPITTYNNQDNPQQILLKITPNSFSLNGPSKGYVAVEIANSDGYPVSANKDTTVTLSVNDDSLLDLKNNQFVIKKGDYFAIADFEVKKSGIATVSASTPSMKKISSNITIDPDAATAHLQLYVYPDKISSFQGSQSYAIVELQNANGAPVKAKEDIFVSVKVTGASQEVIQSSSPTATNISTSNLVIKKGSYWGYSTLSTLAGLEGLYDISIAANNYPSSKPQQLDVVKVQFSASKPFEFNTLPVLVTGEEELIGVLHLVDSDGNPLVASDNLLIDVDSTDKSLFSVKEVKINKGLTTGLVFAQTGITAPSSLQLYDTTDNSKLTTPKIFGPKEGDLSLVADPLIPQWVPGIESPLLLYMLDNANTNSTSYFPDTMSISISNTDLMQIESNTVTKGQDYVLLDTKALKAGDATPSIIAGSFESDPTITILSPKATQLRLSSPGSIISNLPNTFSMELLDENGLPAISEEDKKITLIPNDKSVIDLPESVTIKKGDYYILFNPISTGDGNTELSIISDGLPLLKSDLTVTSLSPSLTITSTDSVDQKHIFYASLNAQYDNVPLSGLKVDWNVRGAEILAKSTMTDQSGSAGISLLSQDPKMIDIQATVSGGILGTKNVEKVVTVNQLTQTITTTSNTSNTKPFSIFGINPLFVIIPGAATVSFAIFKKKKTLLPFQIKNKLRKKAQFIKEKINHAQAN